MSQKFFLYARKSTDVEDKQVLSIDAQITELRAFAKNEKLEIVEEFVEKRTAKIPGRPIFGEMMRRIEKGEAAGILSWHPDRLARNSVDGGQIVYFLDIGNLASLKFPSHWFENTPQGKTKQILCRFSFREHEKRTSPKSTHGNISKPSANRVYK
ncbi:MAG: Recombinase [Parcubacteria group bacterium GW2011_GWF2_40_69]|nr:MAG: Recombinase [Parcubacteria group bacterium GW2011_GWF2_40_69]